jgi:hypothetical protein
MSTRSALKKRRPQIHKRSLNVLSIKAAIDKLKTQIDTIGDEAKAAKRELLDSESREINSCNARISSLKSDLVTAEESFTRNADPDDVIYIRALSGAGRMKYLELSKKFDGVVPGTHIAALGLCDEGGSVCFNIDKPTDIEELGLDVDGEVLQIIATEVFRVSGLAKDAVEEAEKKSEASPS